MTHNLTHVLEAFVPAKTDKNGMRFINHATHVDAIKADAHELALAVSAGKGAIKRDATAEMFKQSINGMFEQFQRANCTNVAPLARGIRSIMGQTTDTKSLSICPMTREGFYSYPATVALWASEGKTDKIKATRTALLAKVRAIVDTAQALYDKTHNVVENEPAPDMPALTTDSGASLESTAETAPETDSLTATADASTDESARINADAEMVEA